MLIKQKLNKSIFIEIINIYSFIGIDKNVINLAIPKWRNVQNFQLAKTNSALIKSKKLSTHIDQQMCKLVKSTKTHEIC